MKISLGNLSPAISKTDKFGSYLQISNPQDSFERTSTSLSPSFKQGYRDIFSDPKKSQQIINSLIAIGGLVLAGEAAKNAAEIPTERNNRDSENPIDFLSNLLHGKREDEQKTQQKLQQLEDENRELKETISGQNKLIEGLTKKFDDLMNFLKGNNTNTEQKNIDTQTPKDSKTEEGISVIFPKKRGRYSESYSESQTKLKTVTESMKFASESAGKVIEICKELLKKEPNLNIDKEKVTLDFAQDLLKTNGDLNQVKTTVDSYYELCGLNKNQNQSEELEKTPEDTSKTDNDNSSDVSSSNSQTELFRTNGQTYNPLGKIEIGSKKPEVQEDTPPSAEETEGPQNDNTYKFRLPSEIKRNVRFNLSSVLERFKLKYLIKMQKQAIENGQIFNPKDVIWMYKKPVSSAVLKDDVIKDIDRHKRDGKQCKYKNIDKYNAETVAEIISSKNDPRFKQLFSLHGALRFVERFVDLDCSAPEDLAIERLNILVDTIQTALKKGVKMEKYEEKFYLNPEKTEYEIRTGTNIIIPEEYYSPEAQEIFGEYPLKIGLCIDQSTKYNDHPKALICTIHPDGI